MPGGIHLLLGLLLTIFIDWLLRSKKYNKHYKDERQSMRLGMAYGSVLPDIDILVVVITLCVTYLVFGFSLAKNQIIAEYIHRSITHSLFILIPMFCISMYLYHKYHISRCKVFGFEFNLPFMIGLSLSMIAHTLCDTCYMKGVRMLWPIYDHELFFEVPFLGLFDFHKYSPFTQKILLTSDQMTEVGFYLLLLWASPKLIDMNEIKCKSWSHYLHHFTWSSWKDIHVKKWWSILYYICIIQPIVLLVWFVLGVYASPLILQRQMDYAEYFVFLYFPATVFMIISLLAPLCFSSVIRKWNWNKVLLGPKLYSKSKRYADGAVVHNGIKNKCS